jgi:hypothetical protein
VGLVIVVGIFDLMENLIVVLIEEDALEILNSLHLHHYLLCLLCFITAIKLILLSSFFVLDLIQQESFVRHQLLEVDLQIRLHNIRQHRLKLTKLD